MTLLQAVSQLDETSLQHELGRLVEAEIVYQRGVPPQATYIFKHALIQDAAYESLLKSTRQHYHQRIAQVLEAQFPETAETQPELLAHHYTEAVSRAGSPLLAHGWSKSQRAFSPCGSDQRISQGLALLQTLPETPERLQQEVDLLIALGASLRATQGSAAPEVGQTYTRARQLCQHLEDPHQLFPVLRGLVELLSRTCRVADGACTGRAAPDPGAAVPGLCHACGGAPCLRGDIILPGSDQPLRTRTLYRVWRSTIPSSTAPRRSSMGTTLA